MRHGLILYFEGRNNVIFDGFNESTKKHKIQG